MEICIVLTGLQIPVLVLWSMSFVIGVFVLSNIRESWSDTVSLAGLLLLLIGVVTYRVSELFIWISYLGFGMALSAIKPASILEQIVLISRNVKKMVAVNSLREAVDKMLQDKLTFFSWRGTVAKLLQSLAYPGKFSFFVSLGVLLLIYFVSFFWHKSIDALPLVGVESQSISTYSFLRGIQSTLAGAAVPIMIFIIESNRDGLWQGDFGPEIFVKNTWIFPISIFSLAGCSVLWLDPIWAGSRPSVISSHWILWFTIIGVSFSYYKALQLIFPKTRMGTEGVKLLKEKLTYATLETVRYRSGNWILNNWCAERKVSWNPFFLRSQEDDNYIVLKTNKTGRIKDIYLKDLEFFLKDLDRFKKSSSVVGEDVQQTLTMVPEEKPSGTSDRNVSIQFRARFMGYLTTRRNGVLALWKGVYDELKISNERDSLEKVLNGIIVLSVENETPEKNKYDEYLNYIRDSAIKAVRTKNITQLKLALETYLVLVVEFMELVHDQIELVHDRTMVEKERSELDPDARWHVLEKIEESMYEIFDEVMRSEDRELIDSVLVCPVQIARAAYYKNDLFVYTTFLRISETAYKIISMTK